MADIGLGGDEGHRHPVAQLALAQVRVEDERVLVGRAEARGEGHRADHHVTGVVEEGLVVAVGLFGVIDGAHRMGVAAVGAGALHFLEGQTRPRRDDQVVVLDHLAVVHGQRPRLGVDLLATLGDEVDVLALEVRADVEGDAGAIPPAHGHPGIGGHELEVVPFVDDGDLMFLAERFTHFVRGRHAAGACTENNDV